MRAGHFSDASGDMFFSIQALTEKNKQGEEGCRIYVSVAGGGVYAAPINAVNDLSVNTRIANKLGAQVAAMLKEQK